MSVVVSSHLAGFQTRRSRSIARLYRRPASARRPDARKPVVLTRADASATPDLQMIFVDSPIHPRFAPGPEDGYSVIFSAMTPASRGSVRLASADPHRAPVIDPNYLADDRDLECMVTGLGRAREIGAAVALTPVRDVELFPGLEAHTDDELRKYLRRSISTYFHRVGTCEGPWLSRKFLGANPSPQLLRDVVAGLRDDNEITLLRLVAMAKGLSQ